MSKEIKTTVYLPVEVTIPANNYIGAMIEERNISLDIVQKLTLKSLFDIPQAQDGIQKVFDVICANSKSGKVEDYNIKFTLVKPGVLNV